MAKSGKKMSGVWVLLIVCIVVSAVIAIIPFLSINSNVELLDYGDALGVDREIITEEIEVDTCEATFTEKDYTIVCGPIRLYTEYADNESIGRVLLGRGFESEESGTYGDVRLEAIIGDSDGYYRIEGIKM